MIEHSIISNLLNNDEFTRKVIPYLRSEYFDDPSSRIVFTTFENYFNTYKSAPTKEALYVSLDKRRDLDESAFKEVTKYVEELTYDSKTDPEFLFAETERFCQEQDLYLTIRRAIGIIEGKDKDLDRGALPKLLQDSLGISFDTRIGHNYIDDAESRYEYYHREETRLPFDIDIFNKITQGGVAQKSLTCFIGGTGTGKSLVMCHMAAANYMHGKNVLYITLELAEEEVSRRIDANLLDCEVGSIKEMPQEEFMRKINRVKSKSTGSLTVKEYPTGTMNANHIRHVLNEIKVKQGISIDVIYLDYINLCTSFRVKNTNANSYTIVKSIAEEMRGLSMEYGIPVITATQPNREGMNSSDLELGNTSESVGLPFTLDAFFALISNEDLEKMGQIMVKQLKNRWGDLNYYKKFMIGIDRSKMRLYNLDEGAQTSIRTERVQEQAKPAQTPKFKKKLYEADEIS